MRDDPPVGLRLCLRSKSMVYCPDFFRGSRNYCDISTFFCTRESTEYRWRNSHLTALIISYDLLRVFDFLRHILSKTPGEFTILVMEENSMDQPAQYTLRPKLFRSLFILSVLGFTLLLVLVFTLSPILDYVPGRSTQNLRINARANQLVIDQLQDSLLAQDAYLEQIRKLFDGLEEDDNVLAEQAEMTEPEYIEPQPLDVNLDLTSINSGEHAQPAVPVESMPAVVFVSTNPAEATKNYLSSLRLPFLPPVDRGYLTRGFNSELGHYGIDYAVAEGSPVRSVGDGYVVFADWTYDAGYVVGIHHPDGYVSFYKHNKDLIKKVGDRVRERETVAISGNSGELSSGPHIHFELWREGLAQDPGQFMQ